MLGAVIVLSILSAILFIFNILFLIVAVNYYNQICFYTEKEKEYDEKLKCSQENIYLLEQQNKHYFNEMIAAKLNDMIYIMNMCKISCEIDDYSRLYNQLYFLGINKEILDDKEKSKEFIEDIQNGLYMIKESEPPFQYKFIKINNQESK